MIERPILFSTPMVQAILAGNKTQTRRVMKVQPSSNEHQLSLCVDTTGDQMAKGKLHWIKLDGMNIHHDDGVYFSCPYGQIGDQLWVRETFSTSYKTEEYCRKYGEIHYRADCDEFREEMLSLSWTPSIHMPRWASRIQLEITNIRVERLKDISEADARAEGGPEILGFDDGKEQHGWQSYREWYQWLWEQINGIGSWDANPWVWVIEFKRVEVQQ